MSARLALLATALMAAPLTAATAPLTAATAPRPWTAVATATPAGSFVIGNPKARVKLVEYVSYTCPHCAHFMAESGEALKAMVRSGSTSIEIRNQVHDKLDLAAATLAHCADAAVYPALHEALFARQNEWLERAVDWDEANGQRLAMYPQTAQLRAMVDGAGLTAIAAAAGMPAAKVDACFASDAALRRTVAISSTTTKASGTPTFEINGKLVERVTWAQLEPMLRAAGAK